MEYDVGAEIVLIISITKLDNKVLVWLMLKPTRAFHFASAPAPVLATVSKRQDRVRTISDEYKRFLRFKEYLMVLVIQDCQAIKQVYSNLNMQYWPDVMENAAFWANAPSPIDPSGSKQFESSVLPHSYHRR